MFNSFVPMAYSAVVKPLPARNATHSIAGGATKAGCLCAYVPARRAFTLIELIITIAIAGIAILALVSVFQESLKNMERQRALQSANLLGEELMNEIRSKKYVDSQFPTNFGPETWTGETNRLYFDDVDDYDNYSESPPRTIEGAGMTNLSGFTWRAIAENVPGTNFNSPPVADNSTDFKRITLIVSNTALAVSNLSVVSRYD